MTPDQFRTLLTRESLEFAEDVNNVLDALATWQDEFRPFVRVLAADIAMPVERVRAALHYLGAHRLATFGPVCENEEGRPNGSTWWLTETGVTLRNSLDEGRWKL